MVGLRRGKRGRFSPTQAGIASTFWGAYSPDEGSLISEEGSSSCDAEIVKNLLRKIREANPHCKRIVVVLDNARYQKNEGVKGVAEGLGIELMSLPHYFANLNLIERLFKFMKKKLLRNKYYPTFEGFVQAVKEFLRRLDMYKAELKSLMTENFQLLKAA